MANKMLIDATHPEETRVVVVRGNRVEEFDYESASRRQLRGNIYLAKVTRVEPSLQAAFVEYGGNRHGFLAFSEIHPDYYQIPVADRLALIEEEERAARAADEEDERRARRRDRPRARRASDDETVSGNVEEIEDPEVVATIEDGQITFSTGDDDAQPADDTLAAVDAAATDMSQSGDQSEVGVSAAVAVESDADDEDADGDVEQIEDEEEVEQIGSTDALEEVPERAPQRRGRTYKIQEVIRRRQVMLVQVVKEERGNKGAALTTYLSLAGRYSVLMPNTARGGGISRKITNAVDRKRLKDVVQDLEVPEGMGIILRTAGANRTKVEIKRDFEYLLRLWETVRELTLGSTAPNLVYEEGSLIKRAIRDLFNKDIDDIHVAGEDGYAEARNFMRMLMPSHARNVVPYRETQPIFAKYGVEQQLDAMFSPVVQLKSGGYIVINPTEALVSIDVNSGRATREHHIEDTALKTNMEAAEEIARQLRLRDLAGLIVIDFIDMEEKRNNRAVERKLKDCLKNDRARIQVGRISHFGLMEMSRQRIRTGVLESSIEVCPVCGGTGHVRSAASVALQLLRALEDQLLRSASHNLIARTRGEVALYVLNQKRAHLHELEERFSVTLIVCADEGVTGHQPFLIEKADLAAPVPAVARSGRVVHPDSIVPEEDFAEEEAEEAEQVEEAEVAEIESEDSADRGEDNGNRRRRRRRRRRGERDGEARDGEVSAGEIRESTASPSVEVEEAERAEAEPVSGDADGAAEGDEAEDEDRAEEQGDRRRRRRGRRGGRRNRREGEADGLDEADDAQESPAASDEAGEEQAPPAAASAPSDGDVLIVPAVAQVQDEEAAPALAVPQDASQQAETPVEQAAPVEPEQPRSKPVESGPATSTAQEPAPAKPVRRRSTVREKAPVVAIAPPPAEDAQIAVAEPVSDEAEPVVAAPVMDLSADVPSADASMPISDADFKAGGALADIPVTEALVVEAPVVETRVVEVPVAEAEPKAGSGRRSGWWQRNQSGT